MSSAAESYSQLIRLFSTLDLEELSAIVGEIFIERTGAAAVGVVLWDKDLEALSDRFWSGEGKKELAKIGEPFSEDFEQSEKSVYEVDLDELGVNLPDKLQPVVCVQLVKDDELCACVLLGGTDLELAEIEEAVKDLPLAVALSNAWEFSETKRENERLRSSYEEIEEKTSILEEQTMKLIHDVTIRDAIKMKQVERDRLVFSISNVVRSSVDIQKVLATTVDLIGATFAVSRCLLLRSVDTADQLDVYEFHTEFVPPASKLFFSDAGFQFTLTALSKTVPQDLGDPNTDDQSTYDRDFLRQLGIRSGLIVPLIIRERVLGVLFLQDCLEPRDWSIDDISLIGSLADNVSIGIENAELHQEIARQAVTDSLTGVANRRSFNESFSREFERARRYSEPLSLIVIDLDYLKKINDTYGHKAGDEAIKAIGKMLKQSSRASDVAARYGGEEFCLLLPNTELDMAEQLAERLRRKINEVHVEGPGNISASMGVASYPLHADDPESLFMRADEALYDAKQRGRNQVCTAASEGGKIEVFASPQDCAKDLTVLPCNEAEENGKSKGNTEKLGGRRSSVSGT
ncbi:MAG TPA: sensor domain-containing diguanylate cyclase [Candidatus Obscuribacterales bacterium]